MNHLPGPGEGEVVQLLHDQLGHYKLSDCVLMSGTRVCFLLDPQVSDSLTPSEVR